VAALEDGRRPGVTKGWEDSTSWEADGRINLTEHLGTLIDYLSLAILDPASLHDDIHPAPVSSAPKPKLTKFVMPTEDAPEEDTTENERLSRYRVGGLVGLARIVQRKAPEVLTLLRDPLLWSALSPDSGVGFEQPAIRKSAYGLLDAIVDAFPEEVGRPKMLSILSKSVLGSCWIERDASVWQQAGQAVVKFLSSE
jgi:hypothetical protein